VLGPNAQKTAETAESRYMSENEIPPTPQPPPRFNLAGRRVLLVEDNPDHQPLLHLMLTKAGAKASIAEQGEMAIELARAARDEGRPFDAIIMDMQMPVVDGYSATRELRRAGFTLPILALTARAFASERDRCLDAGCDDFLTKPFDRNELLDLLVRHLPAAPGPMARPSLF
jgi:CheY-like chemotaxis protein